jgi:hypothetical protein
MAIVRTHPSPRTAISTHIREKIDRMVAAGAVRRLKWAPLYGPNSVCRGPSELAILCPSEAALQPGASLEDQQRAYPVVYDMETNTARCLGCTAARCGMPCCAHRIIVEDVCRAAMRHGTDPVSCEAAA